MQDREKVKTGVDNTTILLFIVSRNSLGYDTDTIRAIAGPASLQRLKTEYDSFSKVAGLPKQQERMNIAGFGPNEGKQSNEAYRTIEAEANSIYNTGSTDSNIDAYFRDKPIRDEIENAYLHKINIGRQNKHIVGTNEYNIYADKVETSCFIIHYSRKKGWHIVPDYMRNKGAKGK